MKLLVCDYGIRDYVFLWEQQKRLLKARIHGDVPDLLILTEHSHVYTLGRTADPNHLVATGSYIAARGISVIPTDRGGGVTYHGPGQLVVYPIISLETHGRDLHLYLRLLERSIIRMMGAFGIEGSHDEDFTGVWVGSAKIASIGIRVKQWVTMHGAAINVAPDLTYFQGIIACGIFHRGVTSMTELLGRDVSLREAREAFIPAFCDVFGFIPEHVTPDEIAISAHTDATEI